MMLTPQLVSEYDSNAPDETETATFGLGCFWGPDAAAGAIDGVVRTRVGYAGGTKPDPSYDVIGDHTEVVQAAYDPDRISFRKLLEWAFSEQQPYRQPRKRQYHNIVFTETADQHEQLQAFLDDSDFDRDRLETRFEELDECYVAEDYHQKFQLRGKRWITDVFDEANYDAEDVRESPAAAKLNAHAAGHEVDVPFLEQSYDRRSK
ncbi:peptide-methionine (S)-S-oxide reductase [Natronobacterium texcoconense]|uniref:peptide-methionine (S)-S-oxide reductase n=1 Tax=Natronobacterium texcoconense TaxID=1095778 RepID=A0A1H1FXH0_NATTX|nr:peptide-methionine (S)-S-oxide reductase [Natronobacterium texcoconense]SDR05642.1 peptide-methionine (S)-S-oxide reductase [Natronobacterium texcoconense]